jgi:hypothetical protein
LYGKIFFVTNANGTLVYHPDRIVQSFDKPGQHVFICAAVRGDSLPMLFDQSRKLHMELQVLPFQRLLPVVEYPSCPHFGIPPEIIETP